MTDPTTPDYRYWAFISYSSKDAVHARWLHRAIETYGIPAKLVEHGHTTPLGEPAPKQFKPVFRDRDELPASADLGEAIQDALAASRCLIVICSPHAAISPWVNREIETFIEMGRGDRIFAYIVDGEPNSDDERECFPPVLRRPVEPLAADARQSKDGRNDAKLKLLAGMLGVGFDALKQRDTQRRVRRLQVVVAAVLLLALVLSGLAWYANAARLRAEAAEANAVNESYVRATAEAQAVSESHVRATAEANAVTEAHARATAQAVAEDERNRAEDEARIARVRELAAKSQAVIESQPQHSLLLGIEAVQLGAQATQALTGAKNNLYQALSRIGGLGLSGHRNWTWRMAFSLNSQRLVTGGQDGTARVWDMTESPIPRNTRVYQTRNSITSVAVSPDGRWLAAADGDLGLNPYLVGDLGGLDTLFQRRDRQVQGAVDRSRDTAVYLWDLNAPDDRPPIVLGGYDHIIHALAFSPDNRWLATGNYDATVRLWSLEALTTTQPIILHGHEWDVLSIAFSPDGRRLVTGSADNTARVWDLSVPEPDKTSIVLAGHTDQIQAMAMSSDGHWLVTGSEDKTARLWDLTAPDPASTSVVIAQHKATVAAVAISPDNRWVATGGFAEDNTVHLVDLAASQSITDSLVFRGHERSVIGLAFSPDSHWLVSASLDSTLRAWNITSPDPVASVRVIRGQNSANRAIAVSPDGRWLVAGSEDGNVRRWAMSTITGTSVLGNPATIPLALMGHKDRIVDLAVSPDGRWLATGSKEATARLWDLHSFSPESFFSTDALPSIALEGHRDEVYKLAFSADSHWLATASLDDTARLWDLKAANPAVTSLLLEGHEGDINAVAFSPDGHWLVTASDDRTARLWDIRSTNPAEDYVALTGHQLPVLVAEFSSNGRWLATGSMDATARLWDMSLATPEAKPMELTGHTDHVIAMAFSPDNHWLATGSADHTARLWDLTNPESSTPVAVLSGHVGYVTTVAFSPDCRWLVTGGAGSLDPLRLWDLTSEDPAASPIILQGHKAWVWNSGFTPDGRWLITSSLDGTVRLWDMATVNTDPSSIVLLGKLPVLDHAVSPDGRWLFTADERGAAFIWPLRVADVVELACLTVGRNMSLTEWEQTFYDSPYRLTCTDFPLHPALIQRARLIAEGGDMARAMLYLKTALEIDPTLDLEPETEVKRYTAEALREEGALLAQTEGDVQGATEKFRQALELYPELAFDAEAEAGHYAAPHLLDEGRRLAREGEMLEALALYDKALQLDPHLMISASYWNYVCWYGGLWDQAQAVMDACERAVALNPIDGNIRDSRGLVRSLLGQYSGAIEDFQYFIAWLTERNGSAKTISQREAWVATLEEGRNPFDAATLEALRGK